MRFFCLSLLLAAVVFVGSPLWADGIPVTGSGGWAFEVDADFSFSGPGLQVTSGINTSTQPIFLAEGINTFGTLNDVDSHWIIGWLHVTQNWGCSSDCTVPITVFGTFNALGPYDNETGRRTLLWTVAMSGTGTASEAFLSLPPYRLENETISFTGTATPLPEPQSFALVGAGLLACAGVLRRKLIEMKLAVLA
jgi:hypothetical protein